VSNVKIVLCLFSNLVGVVVAAVVVVVVIPVAAADNAGGHTIIVVVVLVEVGVTSMSTTERTAAQGRK